MCMFVLPSVSPSPPQMSFNFYILQKSNQTKVKVNNKHTQKNTILMHMHWTDQLIMRWDSWIISSENMKMGGVLDY